MNEYEQVCILCHRTESQAGRMTPLINGMCVCQDCMNRTMEMVSRYDFGNMGLNPDEIKEVMNNLNIQGFNRKATTDTAQSESDKKTPSENGQEGSCNKKEDTDIASSNETPYTGKTGGSEVDSSEKEDNDPDNNPEKKNEPKGTPLGSIFSGMPNISFLNMADLFGGAEPGRARVKKKEEHKPIIELKDIPAPHEIKEKLDEYVIGQEKAKKIISVAVYNHYKRVATDTMDEIEIEKSNVLMIGPTGSGKTYLVKTLARILDVPLAITDATSLTEAGYIGDDIESVVSKLLAAADNDVDRAEQGIIFIDEIDKIAKKHNHGSRDVNGESVQQGMLKLLEGANIEVPVGASSKNAMVPMTTINTRNILFICGGAFPELDEIIKQRLRKKTSIGYGAELKDQFDHDKEILNKVTIDDLKKFGMIPEFLGRLPIVCTLQGLSEEMLVRILKEPRNAILKQYEKLLELDEVKLEFTDEALGEIAKRALEKDTGARALRAIIEELMLDIMYEIPKDDNIGTVTITKEYIEGTGGPIIDIRSKAAHVEKEDVKEPENND
ncbi:MAG: ATP-dependent Clp protease ATP-binding subunit ClpX [Lachnospiraceae bacterium]|nr:ATP-dependent Clp protease ATP-binding subunit ClpX [Candidatus Colinaster scatohippi]